MSRKEHDEEEMAWEGWPLGDRGFVEGCWSRIGAEGWMRKGAERGRVIGVSSCRWVE